MGIKSLFKHLLLTTAVLSIYACGGGGESSSKTETIIEIQKQQSTNLVFADQNLTDCVQALIDSEDYTLVEQIKQLNCSDKSITDIEGIQNLSSLELLNLSNNLIRDITPISKLGRLKQLYLQGNNLQLLSPITENQLLVQVDISDNDAIICSEQTKLEQSIGKENLIVNQPCIEGMQQAQDVNFDDLNLQACIRQTAQDIGAQHLEQIQQLKCVNQTISNINGIEQLTNLRELDLTQNNIIDIAPLEDLALLKKVLLGKNQISNIQPLTTSKYMQELRLDYNEITDIQYVTNLDALRQVHLTNNQIRDITPLQSLTKLLELRISNNRIIDIDSLANLPKLSSLWIQGNQIVDLSPLQSLQNLEQLWLSNNWLTDLTPLQAQSKLKWLHLDGTEAADLQPLNKLTHLKWLQLDNTRVDDITAIYPLTKLDWLHLKGNNTIPCSQLDHMEEILTAEKIDRPETCSQPQEQSGNPISTIEFQDEDLRDCVYDAAREQGITNAEELTSLSCNGGESSGQITDITELEQFPGITSIDLSGNDHIACTQLDDLRERYDYGYEEGEYEYEAAAVALTLPESCNNPPSINTQTEQTVETGTQVDLNAEATDPNGDSLTYNWQQIAGQSVQLTNPNTATPSFTAPQGEDQTITFQLTVTDQYGLSTTQTINILVTAAILGSKNNPFLVTSYEDLKKVGTGVDGWNLDSHYLQTADIDATPSKTENPIPDTEEEYYGFEPIGKYISEDQVQDTSFKGGYNGGRFTIDGLTINRPEHDEVGLFSVIIGSTIENIDLTNIHVSGRRYVGGLVAVSVNSSIYDSYAAGKLTSSDSSAGGLVGINMYESSIVNSYSKVKLTANSVVGSLVGANSGEIINSFSTGSVIADSEAGGLVGVHNYGVVRNCYATGNVSGNTQVGGLIGLQQTETVIINSYARGSVTGNSQVGGLVGQMLHNDDQNPAEYSIISNSYSTGQVQLQNEELEPVDFGGLVGASTSELNTVSNSFWDIETSGMQTSAGGTPKTSDELKTTTTFTNAGWDFDETWMILSEGYTYPRLAWNTIEIDSWTDLDNMRNNLHANYVLTRDLLITDADYAELAGPDANDGQGWDPIPMFMGTLDGNDFVIDGLIINRPEEGAIGLFRTTGDAQFAHINLSNVSIYGITYVGALSGSITQNNDSLSVYDVNVSGSVNSTDMMTGGIVGNIEAQSDVFLINSSFDGSVSGNNYIGGLVGFLMTIGGDVQIINSRARVDIEAVYNNIGGLTGFLKTESEDGSVNISDTHVAGNVTGGNSHVGGLVGFLVSSEQYLSRNSFDGAIIGRIYVGGLVGRAASEDAVIEINDSNVVSSIEWAGQETAMYMGGVVGDINGMNINIYNSYADSNIKVDDAEGLHIGGALGYVAADSIEMNQVDISGDISIAHYCTQIGGIAGRVFGLDATNIYSNVNIELLEGGTFIGGLAGYMGGDVNDSNATGDINVYARGFNVGGLGGRIDYGSFSNTYSSGDIYVGGSDDEAEPTVNIGGFAGRAASDDNLILSNIYASGNVIAPDGELVGGLIGSFSGELHDSYSSGIVKGAIDVGGLLGYAHGEVANSFWDIETSGQETSAGGTGLSTEEMQNQYTFESAGWDFTTIWEMEAGSYPVLQ